MYRDACKAIFPLEMREEIKMNGYDENKLKQNSAFSVGIENNEKVEKMACEGSNAFSNGQMKLRQKCHFP